jgi:hypothetical protein
MYQKKIYFYFSTTVHMMIAKQEGDKVFNLSPWEIKQ